MTGSSGDDNLKGGPGDDRLFGGGGKDVAIGGPGTDTCRKVEFKQGLRAARPDFDRFRGASRTFSAAWLLSTVMPRPSVLLACPDLCRCPRR